MPVVPPVELQRLRPPEVELDVELDGEADATEDLYGGRGHVAERLPGVELGHRREPLHRLTGSARPRRLPRQRLRTIDRGRRVGQVVRDRLERTQRLVELLAGLRIV